MWSDREVEKLQDKILDLERQKIYYESYIEQIHSSLSWKFITKIRNNFFLSYAMKPVKKLLKGNDNTQKEDSINFVEEQINRIEDPSVIAICHKDWLGVRNATEDLFTNRLLISEIFSKVEAYKIASIINKKDSKVIVFSGFAQGYDLLAREIKNINPQTKIMIFWHGNTTHMYEEYSWSRHYEIIKLCREGVIENWGFAKESMVDVYKLAGYPAEFVMNCVPKEQKVYKEKINRKQDDEIRIGIYASGNTWNKNAYTQIAAASLIKDATIHCIPYNNQMEEFSKQLGVEIFGSKERVSREELLKHLGSNDINFYVTFSECAPLLPLESLNMGVLCLTGTNHHYFNGHPLYDYLVVSRPDDPKEIADKALRALDNRLKILELYDEWYEIYCKKAKESLSRFIGDIYE